MNDYAGRWVQIYAGDCNGNNFELHAQFDLEPMKLIEWRERCECSEVQVMIQASTFWICCRHLIWERVNNWVTTIESCMNKRGGDGEGSGKVCGMMNMAMVTNMVVTGTGDGRD